MKRATEDRTLAAFFVVWFLVLLVNLAVLGVAVWAVIELVQWLTSK